MTGSCITGTISCSPASCASSCRENVSMLSEGHSQVTSGPVLAECVPRQEVHVHLGAALVVSQANRVIEQDAGALLTVQLHRHHALSGSSHVLNRGQ